MKKFKFFMLALAGCLSFTACSDDDNENIDPNADIAGIYKLTTWNVPVEQDFNGDGTANINMMNEHPCYNGTVMRVKTDGTFNLNYSSIGLDGSTVVCETDITAGTWERLGTTLRTTHTQDGQAISTNYTISSSATTQATTLTHHMIAIDYPIVSGTGYAYGNGNVSFILARQ